MKLVKCADCEKDISLTSKKCIHCGSEKQFKNLIFMRKELVKDGMTPMEMMNFQKHGGKIKLTNINYKKVFKYGGMVFVVLFIISYILGNQTSTYTLDDGTVVQMTQYEFFEYQDKKRALEKEKLKKQEVIKREKKLIITINKLESFQYGYRAKLFKELTELKGNNKRYKNMYDLYTKVDEKKWDCISSIQKRDKNRAIVQDSFEIVYGKKNRLEGWTANNIFTYVYNYKVKNTYGVMITHTSSNQCVYDKNFHLVKIVKKN